MGIWQSLGALCIAGTHTPICRKVYLHTDASCLQQGPHSPFCTFHCFPRKLLRERNPGRTLQNPLQEASRFVDGLVCPFFKAWAVLCITSIHPSIDTFSSVESTGKEALLVPQGGSMRGEGSASPGYGSKGGIGRCGTGQCFSAFPSSGRAVLSAQCTCSSAMGSPSQVPAPCPGGSGALGMESLAGCFVLK